MSEENTIEEKTQADNFADLRRERDALKAENSELRQFKVNELVRSVNLNPNEGNGAALKELLGSDASEEKARELIAKFGWGASGPTLSKEERAAQQFANRQSDLSSVTTSDKSQTFDDSIADLNNLIAVARAAGNYSEVRRLNSQLISMNNRLLAQRMAVKARG